MKLIAITGLVFCALVLVYGEPDKNPGIVAVKTEQVEENSDGVVETSFSQNDDEDLEVFQPTTEWQNVLPGQAIPAGLHVRMNLQSGKKEAKLMDGDDGQKYQIPRSGPKQKLVKIDKNFISKTKLKQALKDFKDVFHDGKSGQPETVGSEPGKFRSMEEIRKELQGADIFMKKDIDILKEHVDVLNSSSSTVAEKAHALDEIEYYVHQIDNALDFDTIGGLSLIVKYLNSSESELRRKAAHVLGSAVQSNPKVQAAALKEGAMSYLLRLLSKTEPMEVRRKALYALSSLIRLFYKGQQKFLKLNGLETFIKLFDESGTGPLRIKVITLMTDLLHEQIDFVTKQFKKNGKVVKPGTVAERVPLLKAMVKQGWCDQVPSLLNSNENDIREKVLQALHVMVAGCKQNFQTSKVQDNLKKLKVEWQKDSSGSIEPDDYIAGLSQLVSELINKLK